ncbi:MAG: M23 family metallopeptidase [Candidatus Hodarchaeota archaeon]
MEIHYLPSEYIVSAVRKTQTVTDLEVVESDFLLRALRLVNDTSLPVQIVSYCFTFKSKGIAQRSSFIPEIGVRKHASEVSEVIAHLSRDGSRLRKIQQKDNLHRLLGTDKFWVSSQLVGDNTLYPGKETGLMNEHFRVLSETPIDELLIDVTYEKEGQEEHTSVTIPVRMKEKLQDYIFPVKGKWIVGWNWVGFDCHRGAYSQEFAFDLFRVDDRLPEEGVEKPNSMDLGYGEEIIAIADGKVTSCFDGVPDNPAVGVELSTDEIKEIIDKNSSSLPAGAGNHVILQHESDEYSFYAHMIPGSLRVKKGEEVKQGQVLGLVGNSGNSDGPHLHFHLMDGPDYFKARGLPCHFTNVRNLYGNRMDIVDVDNSPVWTE